MSWAGSPRLRLTRWKACQVEGLAARIADAVAVRRIGTPFEVVETVSSVKSYGEGPVMIWCAERRHASARVTGRAGYPTRL